MKEPNPIFQSPWLLKILQPLRPRFVEVLGVSLFTNILALVVPIFTLQVYDRVVAHQGRSTLVALLIGVLIALVFDFLLRQGRSRMLQQGAQYIDAHLGRELYGKISRLPLATLEAHPASYWHALFNDIHTIRNAFSGSSAVLIADLPFAVLFIGVVWVIAAPIAWILPIVAAAFLFLTWYSTRRLTRATTKELFEGLHSDRIIAELMAGRTTAKALQIDSTSRPAFERAHAHHIRQSFARGAETDGFTAIGQTMALLTNITIISFGALAIIDREMTIGGLIATNMLVGKIVSPFNMLVNNWRGFAAAKQAIHRLNKVFAMAEEKTDRTLEHARPKGALSLEKITYTYPGTEQPVVREAQAIIPVNSLVGLVGRNGCGKSTLLKLVQGLYIPESGRVLLDGGDIRQYARSELAAWMGYVPQDCVLFEGTIKENIAKPFPEAGDEAIIRAATQAGAHEFIKDLPDGYETPVGEGGGRLSGGQRQRIAIARALLRNPPVLLFDEISSNLDTESVMLLQQQLLKLRKEHTVLIATHAIPLLKSCDQIMVMERGQIVMQGPSVPVLAKLSGAGPQPGQDTVTEKPTAKPAGVKTTADAKKKAKKAS